MSISYYLLIFDVSFYSGKICYPCAIEQHNCLKNDFIEYRCFKAIKNKSTKHIFILYYFTVYIYVVVVQYVISITYIYI